MGEVTELIAVMLLARLVVGNASEIGLPFLKQFLSQFSGGRKSNSSSASSSRSSPNGAGNQLNGEEEADGRHQWSRDLTLGALKLDGMRLFFIVFFRRLVDC